MINYAKVRDVKSPKRGSGDNNDRSAGIDFFIPNWSAEFESKLASLNNNTHFLRATHAQSGIGGVIKIPPRIVMNPHSHVLIPSGVVCNMQSSNNFIYSEEQGLALIAFNKSSIGIKQLDVAAQIVDEDYRGEIHISLINNSPNRVELEYGEKIVQFAIVPILLDAFNEVSSDDLFKNSNISQRGIGCFGSTGNK